MPVRARARGAGGRGVNNLRLNEICGPARFYPAFAWLSRTASGHRSHAHTNPTCPSLSRGGTRRNKGARARGALHTASGSHPLPPSGHTIRAWRHVVTTAALGRRAHSHSGDAHASAQEGNSNHSHTQTQRPDETPRWRVQRHDRTATMPGLPGDPRDPDADLLARPRPFPRTLASMRVFSTTHLMQAFATMRLCVQLGTMLFRTAHGWYVTVGLRRFSFMPAPNGCRDSAQSTTSSCTGSGRRAGRGSEGAAA